ncbi:MAG: hypothetical protein WC505_06420 [Patescibacteria group bacterium]
MTPQPEKNSSRKKIGQQPSALPPRSNTLFIMVIAILLIVIIGAAAYLVWGVEVTDENQNAAVGDIFSGGTAGTNAGSTRVITIAKTCTDEENVTTYGGARIDVPEDAIDPGVEITIAVYRGDIGCTVDFEPKGLQLKKPAMLMMAYTSNGLEKVGIINGARHEEKNFVIAFWDEDLSRFVGLDSTYDITSRQVIAEVTELYAGGFVIMSSDELSPEQEPESSDTPANVNASDAESSDSADAHIYHPLAGKNSGTTNTNTAVNVNAGGIPAAAVDKDDDKLDDRVETWFGLDASTSDTDDDGHSDYDEIVACYDPHGSSVMTGEIFLDFCEKLIAESVSSTVDAVSLCREWKRGSELVIDGVLNEKEQVDLHEEYTGHCSRTEELMGRTGETSLICDFMLDVTMSICDPERQADFLPR